ncbi:hypothetical protein ISN45_Aa06g039320 [Arabidopsis thaliana x Arabidopsis arenosa]|uniref:Uncharacterized protein n=1 Tax=Arabidopsis thaliana x Arabidopsis arenosa TaxID=1240361 RepID=A0A8T1Z3D2_9BRAS|nr:hypothetical protein ISN45_Aa06g039320 [Arabidopsis thaliana x Arabidopsis arenosa]
MADTRSKSLFAEAMVREVDETFGSGIDKLEETIADQNAKIGERIHALLLLLRSRNAEEENLQVNARPASPQLPAFPDSSRPKPKPNYVIKTDTEISQVSSLSNLTTSKNKLIPMKYSCEEINKRREAGLCIFCDERETMDHHLKHKGLQIVMMDLEDASMVGVEEKEALSDSVTASQFQDIKWTQQQELIPDGLVQKAILEEESTPQFQVPIANSEILRGCELREVKLELENLEYVVMDKNLENEWVQKDTTKRFEVEGDVESQKMISNTKICSARQLFGKRSQHKDRLKLKKKRKGLKSWMFKYKQKNERLWRLHNHVLPFPNLCDLRIDRLVTTRKRKLLGELDTVDVKYFVRLVVIGEVQAAMIIRTESDYQKETQISLSNFVEKKIKKDLVEVDVAKFGDDDQFSDAEKVFGFNIEAPKTESSNQERLEFPTENNGCLDHFQSMVLMKEEPDSVKINEVKLETHSCNLEPDLIQAKMMVTKANSLCHDASVYVLENLSSTTLRNNQSKLYCGLDGDALQSGGIFKFWRFTDFDIIPLRRQVLPKGRKKTSYKSRRFKFKHRVVPRYLQSGFEVKRKQNSSTEYLCLFLTSKLAAFAHMLFGCAEVMLHSKKNGRLMKQTHMSRLGCKVWLLQTLQDLQKFTLGEVSFQIKHKWRFKLCSQIVVLLKTRIWPFKTRRIRPQSEEESKLEEVAYIKTLRSRFFEGEGFDTVYEGYY